MIKYVVRVLELVIFRNNVFVMEFVGDEILVLCFKDVEKELSKEDFEGFYDFMMGVIECFWKCGDMVYGDLSEYNIFFYDGLVVIDWL